MQGQPKSEELGTKRTNRPHSEEFRTDIPGFRDGSPYELLGSGYDPLTAPSEVLESTERGVRRHVRRSED